MAASFARDPGVWLFIGLLLKCFLFCHDPAFLLLGIKFMLWVIFQSNERSKNSYIGLADFLFVFFFSGKSLKICSRSIQVLRSLTCDFFLTAI